MPIGLLRNSASIWKGLTSAFIPSTEGSVFYWTGKYDGTDLVNEVGTNVPLVSGTGLDAIYDFSVLNDDRFDKGAVIGNGLGLPEYYNSPLDPYFYYDGTSQTTRRYWKLKDFHYFYVQQQTDITPRLLNNWAFLKASATTDTSNVLSSVSELVIYSSVYDRAVCTSSGTIYKESTQAYGEWEYTALTIGGNNFVKIISDVPSLIGGNGYYINLQQATGKITLSRRDSGILGAILMGTKSSYIKNNIFYRIRVQRIENGEFKMYIRSDEDVNFSQWTLVDPTGGSGTNPVIDNTYTTSNYRVVDLDTDDILGIEGEDFDTWTEGTGTYQQVGNGEQLNSVLTNLRKWANLYLYLGNWTYYG
jgi:hypothetical protein